FPTTPNDNNPKLAVPPFRSTVALTFGPPRLKLSESLASNCTTAGDTDALKKGCAPCPTTAWAFGCQLKLLNRPSCSTCVNWANHPTVQSPPANTPGVLLITPEENS